MHSAEIAPVPGPVRRLYRAFAVLLLLALALSPSATLAREAMLPADQGSVPHLIPTAESTTVISVVGDPIPRIRCPAGYTATIYAEGLSSPDGLAFSPAGVLYVAEETAGQVSRIESNGSVTPVISGLADPEGVAFDSTGNLYVVEDVQGGRLVKMATDGMTTTLATDLDAPEGVAWALDGTLYVTESNVQFTPNPFDYRMRVTAISPLGEVTRILTDTLYWSYAGVTVGPDGSLYVTNEASGTGTHDSIFTVDPATGSRTLFASNLVAPEGLRFAAHGEFPLYVAEEDTGGGTGLLSRVEANGSHMPFCTGFYSIEDVIQDENGRLYVSEDSSGSVIVIEADAPEKSPAQAIFLFIGDGMGEAHRTAARWSAVGRSGALAMDGMPTVGWSGTASADNPITDSAAAGTAITTGVKTNNGMIGQDPDGNPLTTILERAQARGMGRGAGHHCSDGPRHAGLFCRPPTRSEYDERDRQSDGADDRGGRAARRRRGRVPADDHYRLLSRARRTDRWARPDR